MLAERLEPLRAQVILATLDELGPVVIRQQGAEEGEVFKDQLFLEGLGAGRDDDPLSAEHNGYQVGQCFANPRARLHKEAALLHKDTIHRPGHLQLSGPPLVAWQG